MNAVQMTHHKMHETVLGVLDQYSSVWNGNPAMVAARGTLNTGIETVIQLQQTQGTVVTGVAQDKSLARRAAAQAAVVVAGAVASYADKTGNQELFDKVDFTYNDLITGKEEDDETTVANILQAGTENLAALTAEGTLTQADLDDLESKAETWETLISKPRQAKAGTKAATNQLPAAILANDRTITRQLDRLMERYRLPNAAFFQEYQTAKVLVDPSYRSTPAPTPPPPTPPNP